MLNHRLIFLASHSLYCFPTSTTRHLLCILLLYASISNRIFLQYIQTASFRFFKTSFNSFPVIDICTIVDNIN